MRPFTFGLRYPNGDVEEIDVQADTYEAARMGATIQAHADYRPGWVMEDLPAGGSGGLVQIFSA